MFETNVCDHCWSEKDRQKLQDAIDEKIFYQWAFAPYGRNFVYIETAEYDPAFVDYDGKLGDYTWAIVHYVKVGDQYVVTNIDRFDKFDDVTLQATLVSSGFYK